MSSQAAIALSGEDILAMWENFLENYAHDELEDLALHWPERRALQLPFERLDRSSLELAELVLERPTEALELANRAAAGLMRGMNEHARPVVRFVELPDVARRTIRELRADDLGHLVAVPAIVRTATMVDPRAEMLHWRCSLCGCVISKPQRDLDLDIVQPEVCDEAFGGCGRNARFELDLVASAYGDHQTLKLMEAPDHIRNGDQAHTLTVYCPNDLAGLRVKPGVRVVANLVLWPEERRRNNRPLAVFSKIGHVHSLQFEEDLDEVELTPEDEAQVRELARRPDLLEEMRATLAPGIHGAIPERDAILLALAGGVPKPGEHDAGARERGDVHVLLVGDPSTAKSRLIRHAADLAPRSVMASGKAASAAGLTAAAVRDDSMDGRWSVEAGALVIADGSHCMIDELDKMRPDDRASLHGAMEQQVIDFNKAGVSTQLQTRCGIIAAANPKLGRFDPFNDLVGQIELEPSLLSRFDLIFIMRDIPDPVNDSKLAGVVLDAAKRGALRARGNRVDAPTVVPIARDLARKYLAYARRIMPVLSDDAADTISRYYVQVRERAKDKIPMTPRNLQGLVRLAEASARLRLSETVTVADAQRAIGVLEESLKRIGVLDAGGRFDIDVLETGVSTDQRTRMRHILSVLQENKDPDGCAPIGRVITAAEQSGIAKDQLLRDLAHLKTRGLVYEPKKDRWRVL